MFATVLHVSLLAAFVHLDYDSFGFVVGLSFVSYVDFVHSLLQLLSFSFCLADLMILLCLQMLFFLVPVIFQNSLLPHCFYQVLALSFS